VLLRDVPYFERPREKALKYGVKSLSNQELLAIILRTGTKSESVLTLANKILYKLESISDLNDLTLNELMSIKGIGIAKALEIKAAIEFGIRIIRDEQDHEQVLSPSAVYELLKDEMRLLKQEHLYALYLNIKGKLISKKVITKGTTNMTFIDDKEIIKWACKHSASAIIISHNHPSGDPTPSMEDLRATEKLIKSTRLVDIPLLDHIIIGKSYYSIRQKTSLFSHK
jgi:DNA repair protein RadC